MAATSAVKATRRARARDTEAWRLSARHAVPVLALVASGPAISLGGAPTWAVPVWSCAALLALLATGIDFPNVRRDRVAQAAAVVLAVTCVQLVPLPPFLLRLLDARSATISAGALSPLRVDHAGAWRPLHLDPGNAWYELQYFAGLLAAYLATKRATVRGHGETLWNAICAAPLIIAGIALAHKAIGLEAVFGLYTPVHAAPPILSPMLNPNHLSALTGAGAIVWTGRAAGARTIPGRIVNACAAVLCGTVCALSLSRGGVAAAVGGLALLAMLMTWVPNMARRSSQRAATQRFVNAAVMGAVVVAAGLYMALEALRSEYASGDTTKFDFIRWSFTSIRQHWLLGAGSGGINAAMVGGGVMPGGALVPRVENIVSDLALAFGVPAALAVTYLLGRWLWSTRPAAVGASPVHIGAFAALVSLGVHDLLDFALWLGGTGFFAAMLAGWMAGTASNSAAGAGHKPRSSSRWLPLGALAVGAAASAFTPRTLLEADQNAAEAMVRGAHQVDDAAFARMFARHPGDPYLPLAGAAVALHARDPRALRFVARAMELSPAWAEPHAVLAQVLAAHGFNAQALLEVRYAAERLGSRHAVLAPILVRIAPDPDTLARTVPPGAIGLHFLQTVASAAAGTPYGLEVDALLLRRDPDDLGALYRAVERARVDHDTAALRALCERLVRAHPRDSTGHLGLVELRVAEHDYAGAEDLLRRAIRAGGDPVPYLTRLAELQTDRRDGPAMRRTVQQMLEHAGANVELRVQLYGQLGRYEVALGNDALGLAAYERADLMAFPGHPYIWNIAEIAARLDDINRLRGACGQVQDEGPLNAAQRALCSRTERATPAALGAGIAGSESESAGGN